MTKNLRPMIGVASGIAAALAFSSCAYDPYYDGGASYGASYNSGGYGGSSTSVFVSTGDPLWGYDPYTYSYYNYGSRRYYDPYLNGYYPIGYRPCAVYGVPHPYGWRSGMGHISPPRHVSNHSIQNCDDRVGNYRKNNFDWARQARQTDKGGSRAFDSRPAPRVNPGNSDSRLKYNSDPASGPNFRSGQGRQDNPRISQPGFKPKDNFKPREIRGQGNGDLRNENRGGLPSYYNKPVNTVHPAAQQGARVMNQNASGSAFRGHSIDSRQAVPREANGEAQGRGREDKKEDRDDGNRRGPGFR